MTPPVLSTLLPLPGSTPSTPGTGTSPASGATSGGGAALFKLQFGQALAALTSDGSSSSASTTGSTSSSGTTAADALQATLQKKIADLLAQGVSLTDIVGQLAASLANQFAASFSGDATQNRAQLQSAFATALSPPGNGPPASIAESAAALAQRFRQVAEVAAGVSGETGQPNRLFAGSISDAASTAGVQPAPDPNTNGPGSTTADSNPASISATLANLTASASDGLTVASAAPLAGTNGSTPIGRVLARAWNAQSAAQSADPNAAASSTVVPTAALGAAPGASSAGPSLPSVASLLGATIAESVSPTATAAGTSTSAQLTAFLQSFSNALALADNGATTSESAMSGQTASDEGSFSSLLSSANNNSPNAPTVSAFLPVQPPFQLASSSADAAQTPSTVAQPPVDPNSIVDQVLRGAFMRTDGTTSQVRLTLVPASLGDVNVQLNVTGGSVSAHIVAQTADARDALLAGQAQLTRSLADAGLKLTSFNVDLSGGGFAGFGQQQQSPNQPQSSGGANSVAAIGSEDEDDAAALEGVSSSGSPAPSANPGEVNYLV